MASVFKIKYSVFGNYAKEWNIISKAISPCALGAYILFTQY